MVKCLNKHGKIDKIDNQKKVGGSILFLSKKITRVLDEAISEFEAIIEQNPRPKTQQVLVQELVNKAATKLIYERNHDLQAVELDFIKKLRLIESKTFPDIDGEMEKSEIQFKIRIVEAAMDERKKMQKKLTHGHPIERNYAESPIFSATAPNVQTLRKLINDSGELVEHRSGYRTITYKSKSGSYLTSFDFKVFVGLQRLWELKGKEKGFQFHYGELAEVLESAKEGGVYELIADSINKLATTSIIMEDFEDSHLQKRVTTDIHNLIQSARLDHKRKQATVLFNDYLHENLSKGNFVRINLTLYQDLGSSTARLLYPLITSLIKENRILQLDQIINTLNLNDISRPKCLQRIRSAFQELQEYRIIDDFSFKKEGKSIKSVVVEPSDNLLESFQEGIEVNTAI